ncbi:FG-GAP-like repeat-containing protein [Solirubrobacter phytolaccae]|uniref:FG-GAP-like repeat-containing protein n=1 Tax=Solirubrobacter phytolaccae TaxID=1404360 RepID=A0A9X3SJC9_9ACTN|nr:FG-GAP-like repeat-containing protein [Solirubrobacter phytolaccae]MDA0185132.1 FG-GAP-like repeat-containing protein [Solirubrobacter phytolaccae]
MARDRGLKLSRAPPIVLWVTARLTFAATAVLAALTASPASAAVPFTTSSISITKPMGIAAGDVDGDGSIDLVTANSTENKASVYLGSGAGVFTQAASSPLTLGGSAPSVAVGDLNHDGRADLVVPDYMTGAVTDTDQVEIFLSGPSGFTPAATLTAGMGTSDATIADLNADTHPDLAISNAADDTLSVFLGDGTGAFTVTPGSPYAVASRDLATGDFNGDGKTDIAAILTQQSTVKLLTGDGTGAFTVGSAVSVGNAYNGLAPTDYDGDGDLDIITSGGGMSGTIATLRNDGAGNLTLAGSVPRQTPSSIVAADFDNDGHPDVAVTQGLGGGKVVVLPGDGTGTFGPATEWATAASPFQLITTDVDGDHRPDLAVTSYGGNQVTVLRNGAVPAGAMTAATAFGDVTVGQSTTQTFTVSSTGTAALAVGTRSLTGTGFSVTGDTCSGKRVASGATCTVTVAFKPATYGAATATLTLPTDAATFTRTLTGDGKLVGDPPPPTPTPQPPATDDAKPAAPPVAEETCVSRRTVTITTPQRLRGGKATITMGKRVIRRVARAGAKVKVDMAGLPRGTVRVTLERGKAREVRNYKTCA